MAKKNNKTEIIDEYGQTELIKSFNVEEGGKTVKYADLLKNARFAVKTVKAKDLTDRTFTITKARQFQSSYEKRGNPFFCTVILKDTGETVGVVLGGGVCIDFLSAYCASGVTDAVEVTLRWSPGGEYSGYYFFE